MAFRDGVIHVSFCGASRTDEGSSKRLPGYLGAAQDHVGKVWHCQYPRWLRWVPPQSSPTRDRTYPDPSFDLLIQLRLLEELHIIHMPEISDLSPLASLKNLRVLTLETLPSWDPSGKVSEVRSLAPLAALPGLEELGLFGVVPTSRMADEVLASRPLRRVTLSKFARGEAEKVAAWLADRA